jgi:hypothetical protein
MSVPGDEAAVGQVEVSADGTDWRDISPTITSINVEDHDRLTDQAKIVLDDPMGILAHGSFEGLRVRIALGWMAEHATIFEGDVTAAKAITQTEGSRVELTALDFSNRMKRRTREPFTYNKGETLTKVVEDTVKQREYSFKAFEIVPAVDTKFDEVRPLQRNVDDLAFIQKLATDAACIWFVEYDGKIQGSKFFFVPIERVASADPVGQINGCRGGGDLISFKLERIGASGQVERTASATDPVTGETVTHTTPPVPERPPLPPPAPGKHSGATDTQLKALDALTEVAAAADKRLEAEKRPVVAEAPDPARAEVKVVPDPRRVVGLQATGTARGTTLLRAKSRVTIDDVAPWAEGDWYLVKVNHVYTRERIATGHRNSYATTFVATR